MPKGMGKKAGKMARGMKKDAQGKLRKKVRGTKTVAGTMEKRAREKRNMLQKIFDDNETGR